MIIRFTGRKLTGMGVAIPATCIVRNELNGSRHANEIVRTRGQTLPNDVPYQPRPFPPGQHDITRILDCAEDGEDADFWPVFIDTDATQELPVWKLKDELYVHPTTKIFMGRGYGIHHARYRKGGLMVRSNTTLGCINITDPDDAQRLAVEIREAMGMRQRVCIEIPPWQDWEV